MKRLIALITGAVVLAACGGSEPFQDLGDRSHGYVVGSTTIAPNDESAVTVVAAPGVTAIEGVRWFNAGIEGEIISEPSIVISTVWARGGEEGRFVQASPAEIDIALPGIEFPAVVPDATSSITSQLVYDPASATLDPNTLAAFGVWSVPPYTDDEGRLAVLRVSEARESSPAGTASASTPDGLNLVWTEGIYRYDLLCYVNVSQDVCWQMSEVMAPLGSVAPAADVATG